MIELFDFKREAMLVDPEALRQTMRMWVSGVTVVTTAVGERRAGVTVSSFTSVALEPPLVLVCLQNHIETYQMIEEAQAFAVSILNCEQAHLSAQFAGFTPLPEGMDRFYNVPIRQEITGAPILTEALAWVDCRLHASHTTGTTNIVVGEVVATGRNDSMMPLAYHNRGYYDIVPQK